MPLDNITTGFTLPADIKIRLRKALSGSSTHWTPKSTRIELSTRAYPLAIFESQSQSRRMHGSGFAIQTRKYFPLRCSPGGGAAASASLRLGEAHSGAPAEEQSVRRTITRLRHQRGTSCFPTPTGSPWKHSERIVKKCLVHGPMQLHGRPQQARNRPWRSSRVSHLILNNKIMSAEGWMVQMPRTAPFSHEKTIDLPKR